MDQIKRKFGIFRARFSRRDAMRSSAALIAALGAVAISGPVKAQGVHGFRNRVKKYQDYKRENPAPSQSWLNSILPNTKKQVDPAATPHPGLFQAAMGATDIGVKSRTYCLEAIKKGDASLAPCLKAIEAMIPVCNALGKLAEIDAGRLKDLANTAKLFLDDCERECGKLASTHPALQPCAAACMHSKLEIKSLLKV